MKTIRLGTFETNSSSTHSITMCMENEYQDWLDGKKYFCENEGRIVDAEERMEILKRHIIQDRLEYDWEKGTCEYKGVIQTISCKEDLFTTENLNELTEEDVEKWLEDNYDRYIVPCTFEEYYQDLELETYCERYTTPNGEKIVAFGYYGNDW